MLSIQTVVNSVALALLSRRKLQHVLNVSVASTNLKTPQRPLYAKRVLLASSRPPKKQLVEIVKMEKFKSLQLLLSTHANIAHQGLRLLPKRLSALSAPMANIKDRARPLRHCVSNAPLGNTHQPKKQLAPHVKTVHFKSWPSLSSTTVNSVRRALVSLPKLRHVPNAPPVSLSLKAILLLSLVKNVPLVSTHQPKKQVVPHVKTVNFKSWRLQ